MADNNYYDVIVIGGGIIGTSTAYYLSKQGVKVILLEQNQLCSMSSGANQAGITLGRSITPYIELSNLSNSLYVELNNNLDIDYEFERIDYLLCSINRDDDDRLNNTYSELINNNSKCKYLDKNILNSSNYKLGDSVRNAILINDGIYILWPFKFVQALANSAIYYGAKVFNYTEVTKINIKNNSINSVTTNVGEFKTSCVVNAAGIFSNKISNMVGINIPIIPIKGEVIVTEATTIHNCRYIMDIDYLKNENIQDKFNKFSTTLMQHKNGNWTIGTSRENCGYKNTNSYESMSIIAKKAVNILPLLKNKYFLRSYTGLRPFCSYDGKPIIGNSEIVQGFYLATGHDGSGIKYGPATGNLIAKEIISGKVPDITIPFRYSRLL